MCSVTWKRVTALVIGVLDMLVAGSLYSYNIYAPSLQLTFNFTQEESKDSRIRHVHSTTDSDLAFQSIRYRLSDTWASASAYQQAF